MIDVERLTKHTGTMLSFPLSLHAWNTSSFNTMLIAEICALDVDALPLQQGLSQSSYASSDKLSVSILSKECNDDFIFVRTGLFYTGTVAGCNCADDPTPVDEINEYCEALLSINRQSGETTISLVS